MNMQQIIQQEIAIQQSIIELLPTIGMLSTMTTDRVGILIAVAEYLQMRNVPEQNIAALQPELQVCVDRVIAARAQLTPPA